MKKRDKYLLVLGAGIITLVVVLVFTSAANRSKPNDLLHSLDETLESLHRALTFDSSAKAALEQNALDERVQEISFMITEGEDESLLIDSFSKLKDQLMRTRESLEPIVESHEDEELVNNLVSRFQAQYSLHGDLLTEWRVWSTKNDHVQLANKIAEVTQEYIAGNKSIDQLYRKRTNPE